MVKVHVNAKEVIRFLLSYFVPSRSISGQAVVAMTDFSEQEQIASLCSQWWEE